MAKRDLLHLARAGTDLHLRVTPKAARNRIVVDEAGVMRVYVTCVPEDGKSQCGSGRAVGFGAGRSQVAANSDPRDNQSRQGVSYRGALGQFDKADDGVLATDFGAFLAGGIKEVDGRVDGSARSREVLPVPTRGIKARTASSFIDAAIIKGKLIDLHDELLSIRRLLQNRMGFPWAGSDFGRIAQMVDPFRKVKCRR